MTGRKPKPEEQRRNRVTPTHAWTEIPDVPFTGRRPKLPRRKGGWPPAAKRRWEHWSRMPHCRLWDAAMWDFALDTLELVARFYEGDSPRATEIRNREKQLGTTPDYLRDLRIRYVEPDAQDDGVDEGEGVVRLDDYRDLYGD